ncbi:efflux RND transporter permease subunit [Chitinispirillales bacterium ANBcel5]|uniref:efflux RND transporter permease subunit n=1 Tax=Cellulosispirillum alkaliphilum TaxID=3039283 RepID=UPI002A513A81|nr:efflux RND transporter permease subunit [Chitinispirillales bacterium ANBcel5]
MNLPGISIRRPLAVIMVILAFTMFGVVSWNKLPLDSLPDMDLPFITVQLIYPGAGPEEVEASVIRPIEDQVSVIAGINNITAYCMENGGFMLLEFLDHIDPDIASIEVKDRIDQIIGDLPADLNNPIIAKYDPNDRPVFTLAVRGEMDPAELRHYVDNTLVEEFSRVPGVANVDVIGGREREIHVNLNEEALAAHGLSVFQIVPFLSSQNVTIPGGFVTGDAREFSVKMDGEFTSLEQIRNLKIPVHKQFGSAQASYNVVLGEELAQVTDSYKDVRNKARFNGQECVQILINKSSDANIVQTVDEIRKNVARLEKTVPQGIYLDVVQSRSTFIENTIQDTYANIVLGIILTALILLLFLGDLRLTFIAALTIPLSLIVSMIGLDILGISLNIVTMMSLTASIGILVTNAIIVIENIVRHRDSGEPIKKAAEIGTNEIATAVLASTLTNLAVFIPIASTTGITESVFKTLGMTIVFASVASLLLSFTLVPLMASRLLKQNSKNSSTHANTRLFDKIMHWLEHQYEKAITLVFNLRGGKLMVVSATVGLLLFSVFVIGPRLGREFMPAMDNGFFQVNIEMPPGTPLNVTEQVVEEVEEILQETPHLIAVSSVIGGSATQSGVQYATVQVEVIPENQRTVSVIDIVSQMRPRFAHIPDAHILLEGRTERISAGDITIELSATNLDTLIAFKENTLKLLDEIDGLTDFNTSWRGLKPEILITPDREKMEHFGLSPNIAQSATIQMIGGMLRFSITGNDEAIYRENGEEFPIRVRLDERHRKKPEDIASLLVPTPRGMVQLNELAKVEEVRSISALTRKNRSLMIDITCNVTDGTPGHKINEIDELLSGAYIPAGAYYHFGGNEDLREETNEQLSFAAVLAVALTLMLLIAILESVLRGIVIFLTIPLGLIGVIWFLFITGNTLSIISSISVIMLIGIVVNNAIILIDYAQSENKKSSATPQNAIVTAAKVKMKAILMANLAIIVSMIPIALGIGSGGSFRAPFAITAIGGIFVSTILTFFLIPIFYVWTSPKKDKLQEA